MPRKLRIEYEGALYHVLNRGNYRRDIFETVGAAQTFVKVLEEASSQYSWRIYAYVLMRNHYHLAIETPKPNLVDGMHWLQSTVATRFNRFRSERGHLFQGRYQAILLEDSATLARVVNYIHLNPVRAKLVTADQAMNFRWSSLARFIRGDRFSQLVAEPWLEALSLSDNKEGWKTYQSLLSDLSNNQEEQKRQGFAQLSHGWAIGTDGWRKALAQDHAHRRLFAGVDKEQSRELKEARWRQCLIELIDREKRTWQDVVSAPKNAPWKIKIAKSLRQSEGASVAWLAQNLHMGKTSTARNYMSTIHVS